MANHGHDVAMPARPGAQNAKPILGVVVGYSLDEARQHFLVRWFGLRIHASFNNGTFHADFHVHRFIPVFIQHLNGLSTVLDKAAAWAAARKVNEADLLNMRLSPDMFNLTRQLRAATDHAANAAGRLAGKELLKFANDETTIAQLKDRIAKTIDYLKSVNQSEIDGTEDKDISITFPSGQTRQFTGQSLLLGNSLPNFWFHTTTAYDIVRQCGVEIGKRDFMGAPA
jgi:hypothetical protein